MPALLSARSDNDSDPLNEADERHHPERLPRTNLFIAALLAVRGQPPRPVRVRNLSASGARVEVADPPPRGTTLSVYRGSAEAAAEVVWTSKDACGLRFCEAIDVARWVSDRTAAAPAEATLADDLALARRLVQRLEDGWSDQPMVAELATEMQALDLLAQLLRAAEKRASGAAVPSAGGIRRAAQRLLNPASATGGF